jgi:ribosomal protein S18 acetylase RimI-like enzyme
MEQAAVKIRLANSWDLPALERMGDRLFDHPVKPERAREFLTDPRHHLFLAFHGEEIVGFASAFHYLHPDKDPILFVNEVEVLEQFRCQGIARRLVRELVAHGKSLGCEEAWIATTGDNLPARRAFTAAGGRETDDSVVLIEYGGKGEGDSVEV